MKKIYIDESGNTGAIKEKNKKKEFNFIEQPYFTLGGILIDESREDEIKKELKVLYNSNNIEDELKYKNHKNKKGLLEKIIKILEKYNCKMFFDVTNKRYKIINYIVDYCVIPYYEANSKDMIVAKLCTTNLVSDILYEELEDKVLYNFIEIGNNPNSSISKLIKFCELLKSSIKSKLIKKQIHETIDTIRRHNSLGLSKKNLFPLIDVTNIGERPFAFLPNIDALNNLIVQLTESSSREPMEIIHDNQEEFSKSLTKWMKITSETKKINGNIRFENSKNDVLIQTIDYITGYINDYFKNVSQYDNNEIVKSIICTKVNLVSTYNEYKKKVNGLNNINYMINDEFYKDAYNQLKNNKLISTQ
ncbi:DUF3800 domain-containing protein [Clostridium beijerinckii]|uniref:DUF3800 domain-containing protein n=1 Tax=Clostridium beijerinckii TaxID=1520 RepID=UPI00242DA748|nr:DUF3800 domain-containing protein [Clostridium beijerinckii]MDG5854383.1 DUF3800 domain-containing protein [Clostridium beijerinckii]